SHTAFLALISPGVSFLRGIKSPRHPRWFSGIAKARTNSFGVFPKSASKNDLEETPFPCVGINILCKARRYLGFQCVPTNPRLRSSKGIYLIGKEKIVT